MELSQFAEQILFGDQLSDKLVLSSFESKIGSALTLRPHFEDSKRGSGIELPRFPGRPNGLSLDRDSKQAAARFPGRSAFETPVGRGMVLHYFANHELLALELMALALLRFPDAPAGFRMGIAQTMLEEQSHMQLYLARMRELGVEFGQMPVNSFFWKCLSPMRSPMEYVSQMSMTFEQANVDFSAHYRDVFRNLGDDVTADILDRVYREEIGHVKHGVVWFDKWRDPAQSQWEAWTANLTFPVNPSRARGIGFEVPARKQMGFSDEYIESLRLFSLSKGRQPKVYLFRPGFEEEMAPGYSPAPVGVTEHVEADLAPLMMYLALQDDVVVAPSAPTQVWQDKMKDSGFDLPHFVTLDNLITNSNRYAPSGYRSFHPWGWSPAIAQVLAPISNQLLTTKSHSQAAKDLWTRYLSHAQGAQKFASKEYLAHFFEAYNQTTCVCTAPAEVKTALANLYVLGFRKALIKPVLAANGRGHLQIDVDQCTPVFDEMLVTRLLEKQCSILVEPLFDRVCDFSIQMTVHEDGKIQEHGIVRLLADKRGQYKGHVIGKSLAGLEKDLTVAINKGDWFGKLRQAARLVGERLAADGFTGPFGIDSFVYRSSAFESGYEFRPLVEINARFTMGRVAVELERRIPHGRTGLWKHFSKNEMKKMGFDSFAKFYESLKSSAAGYVIATNDPATAKVIFSILAVGTSMDHCEELLRPQ